MLGGMGKDVLPEVVHRCVVGMTSDKREEFTIFGVMNDIAAEMFYSCNYFEAVCGSKLTSKF